jgi:hypothetical protein
VRKIELRLVLRIASQSSSFMRISRLVAGDAGIVDEDAERRRTPWRCVDQRVDGARRSDIEHAPDAAEPCHAFADRRRARADVAVPMTFAPARQRVGNGRADAATGAGDEAISPLNNPLMSDSK